MKKKEAIKILKDFHDKSALFSIRTALETLHPEFKESEDELTWLKKYIEEEAYSLSMDIRGSEDRIKLKKLQKSLAWLEKQGDSPIKWNKNTKDCKPKVSHSVLMLTKFGISEGEWQGEQWHQYRWAGIVRDTDVLSWIELSDLDNQGEQKPADKVEPKFKVGNWVVYYRNDSSREVLQVYDIRDGRYYFTDNVHFSWSVKECDEKCHLWTIQDARTGDVLASKDKEDILIYKSHSTIDLLLTSYISFSKKEGFCPRQYSAWDSNEFIPATKEQRDTLFTKIHETGYMWDSESNQLLSLKAEPSDTQKSEWSEEDNAYKLFAISAVENYYDGRNQDIIDWLNSLKQRMGG